MKTIFAAAFAAASLAVTPLPALAVAKVALACSDSAPAGWQRPGGYCDQIGGGGSGGSLSDPTTVDTPEPVKTTPCLASLGAVGDRVHVAVDDGCGTGSEDDGEGEGGCDRYGSLLDDPSILAERGRVLLVAC